MLIQEEGMSVGKRLEIKLSDRPDKTPTSCQMMISPNLPFLRSLLGLRKIAFSLQCQPLMKMLGCSLFQVYKLGVPPTYKFIVRRWGSIPWALRTCKHFVNPSYFIVTDAAHGNERSKTGRPRYPEEGIAHGLILLGHGLLKQCRTQELMAIGYKVHFYFLN